MSERYAFKMQIKAGAEQEYRRRHDEIWPELAALLHEAGVSAYEIFLDPETLTLFAVLSRSDTHQMEELPQHPVMQRWWAYMADLMETHSSKEPVTKPLRRMFHLA